MPVEDESVIVHVPQGNFEVDRIPDACPHCDHKGVQVAKHGAASKFIPAIAFQIVFHCPNRECRRLFIATYTTLAEAQHVKALARVTPTAVRRKDYPPILGEISPKFSEIANEAYAAEQHDLHQICGIAYRKALEFLVKDYAIATHPEQRETVEKIPLAACIGEYIKDDTIKTAAKRAAWLGNDHAHYKAIWQEKSLEDLKHLLNLVATWIAARALIESMSERR